MKKTTTKDDFTIRSQAAPRRPSEPVVLGRWVHFLAGVGYLIGIALLRSAKTDEEAMRDDWRVVGDDLREGIRMFEEEERAAAS